MKKMIKLAYKKMLAFVLVFVMLVGTVGAIGDAKAAESTEIEFKAADAVNWWNASDAENAYALFLKADRTLTSDWYSGLKYEVSDGTSSNEYVYGGMGTYDGMFNMRIPYTSLPKPEDMKNSGKTYTLTFKAGEIESADGKVSIKKDFSIVIKDGSVLGILDTIHTETTYVSGTKDVISIWTTPTPTLTDGNDYHKVVGGTLRYGQESATQTVNLDGIYCFVENGSYYYYIKLPEKVKESVKTGTIVVFDNVIVQDAINSEHLVRLPNFCYQYTEGETPCWQVVEEPTQTGEVTITGIMTYGYNETNNRWNVYVNVEGSIPGENWTGAFTGLTYSVNGQDSSVPEIYKNTDNTLFFYIDKSVLAKDFKGNTQIVLKAGTATHSDDSTNAMKLKSDFVIYANEYAWRTDTFFAPVDAKITGVAGFPLNQKYWSMTVSIDADVPSEGDAWKTVYSGPAVLIDGKEYPIGLQKTLNEQQVSIYTDQLTTENVKDGTEVTIQAGEYTCSETQDIINITEAYTVVYDSSKSTNQDNGWANWKLSIADTKVEGDADGNGILQVKDIIRLMRYLNDTQTILVNRMGADANKSGTIDEKDLTTLRKLIAGSITYEGSQGGMPIGAPYYNNTDKIIRMANACPEPKDFAKYKAAGLNTLNSEGVADIKNEVLDTQTEVTDYLTEAAKHDLDVLLYSEVINHLVNYNEDIDTKGKYTKWKDILDEYVKFYSDYPAFAGFVLADELEISLLSNYTKVVTYLKEKYPNLVLRLPQFPIYTAQNNLTTNTALSLEEAYKEYVRSFGNPLGCFTYDHYSLYYAASKYQVSDDWLKNLKWVSDVAKESNLYTGVTIQTCKGAAGVNRYAPEKESDIGFQIYTAMAFGMQEFGYYTYNPHPTDTNTSESMSANTKVYNAVQSVNQELATFENVFKAFTWKQTLELASGATNSSTNDGNLASVKSPSIASYVGCMRDEEGYYGYMVANAEGPRTDNIGSVTLTFHNATHAKVYYNGKCTTQQLTGNALTVNLNTGEGAFVIPYIAK